MQDIDKAPANMGMPTKNTDPTTSGDGEALGGGKVQGKPKRRAKVLTITDLSLQNHPRLEVERALRENDERRSSSQRSQACRRSWLQSRVVGKVR